jgi:hypothetical protein
MDASKCKSEIVSFQKIHFMLDTYMGGQDKRVITPSSTFILVNYVLNIPLKIKTGYLQNDLLWQSPRIKISFKLHKI